MLKWNISDLIHICNNLRRYFSKCMRGQLLWLVLKLTEGYKLDNISSHVSTIS